MQARNNDNLCVGQRLTEIKYSKQYFVATILVTLSEELLMQVYDDDNLHGSQR